MNAQMEETWIHSLDTETYEAAFYAAVESMRKSDANTRPRLERLAQEDGVVGDAARHLLEDES